MRKGILFSAVFSAVLLGLGACASAPNESEQSGDRVDVSEAASGAVVQTREGLGDAALSPLEDLNIRRDEIPDLLAQFNSPYDEPHNMSCPQIAYMIRQLDVVLGHDWDTEDPDERLATEKLADSASAAALGTIASEARGLIPFRSLVRRATGADSHQKRYNQAFKIGAQRRAYLKGYGLAKGCPAPSRPDFEKLPDDDIVFKGDDPHAMLTPAAPRGAETASLPNAGSTRPATP